MIRISVFLLAFLGLSSLSLYAQVPGISYQAVILSPDGKALPGKNQTSIPLANQKICLKFAFKTNVGVTGVVEYEETHVIETDAYGMVNLTLGQGTPVGGFFATFDLIPWSSTTKFLEVNLDKSGACTNFTMISDQAFTAVPFALYAVNSPPGPQGLPGAVGPAGPAGPSGAAASAADFVDLSTNQTVAGIKTFSSPIAGSVTGNAANVTGTVVVANGGTGATTLTGLLKGDGTNPITAAVPGTDYLAPNGSAAGLTNFPTLNQNTTGNAANVTGVIQGVNGGTGMANTGKTITLGGDLTTAGAFPITLTSTATTSVTLPITGTLYGTKSSSITSAELLESISDETGTGLSVFNTSPSLVKPVASSLIANVTYVATRGSTLGTNVSSSSAVSGTNLAGTITLVISGGDSGINEKLIEVMYSENFPGGSTPILSPGNRAAAELFQNNQVFATGYPDRFEIISGRVGLVANTYIWNYHVIGR